MASNYSDWMQKLNGEDEDMAGPQEQATVVAYLDGKMTADAAAHELGKQAKAESSSNELLWNLLIDVAEEFPQAHRNVLELADALDKSQTAKVADFEYELRETYAGTESAALRSDSTSTKESHYVNLCALIAQYWHRRSGNWTSWAMELCRESLEDEHGHPLSDMYAKAVAQLFLHSGAEMHASSGSDHATGPLLVKARESASIERWGFWEQRLAQLKNGNLNQEARELVSKALESMAAVKA